MKYLLQATGQTFLIIMGRDDDGKKWFQTIQVIVYIKYPKPTRIHKRTTASPTMTANCGGVIPRTRLLRGLGVVFNGWAGFDSRTLGTAGAASIDGSLSPSSMAKSKSSGLNGLASSEASKIARARETSC